MKSKQSKQQQRSEIKKLIAKGNAQGYLTYAEINDHLPQDIVALEQIENNIRILNDMGITVCEKAPSDNGLLLNKTEVGNEEDAEEAAAALASVSSELGRTSDPVRMYMREMGSVSLLNRVGEIRIARRIEAGQNEMLWALGYYPPAVSDLLEIYEEYRQGKSKLNQVITGLVDPKDLKQEEKLTIPKPQVVKAEENDKKKAEKEETTKKEAELYSTRLKRQYRYCKSQPACKNEANQARAKERMAATFMRFKLTQAVTDTLIENSKSTLTSIGYRERDMRNICVRRCGMPRKEFVTTFSEDGTQQKWWRKHTSPRFKYAKKLKAHREEFMRVRKQLQDIEKKLSCR